jgi:hypothetical protein
MQHIGTLDMQFRDVQDDVLYYDVSVAIGDTERALVVPQHHSQLQRNEAFGLPPQHEWSVVVPEPENYFPSFQSSAMLQVDDSEYTEELDFRTSRDTQTHSISVTRHNEQEEERFYFTEDWHRVPQFVHKQGLFVHGDGEYHYWEENQVFSDPHRLTGDSEQRQFVQRVAEEHGEPTVAATKSFQAGGVLPPLYYRMLPVHNIVDLSQVRGWACEVGYLNSDAENGIERQFGSWYKLFKVNDAFLYIEEDGFSSRDVEVRGETRRVRDTYQQHLYRYE